MSYEVRVTAPDIRQQILVLEEYSEILERHVRPAMKSAVNLVGDQIRPNIPVASGWALSNFRTSVIGKGVRISGKVGWWGTDKWYINAVEYGARAHEIGYVPALDVVVHHPGQPARKFMLDGYVAARPEVLATMDRATEATVKDLAVARGKSGG